MGGEESSLKPVPSGFPYTCITLRQWGKIRIIYASQNEISCVRQCVQEGWCGNVSAEKIKFEHCYQFTLQGAPFTKGTSSEEAASARHMACLILHRMYNLGWVCLASSDLTRTVNLTSWIFYRMPGIVQTPYVFGCVSLSSTDKLQIINFPQELHGVIKKSVIDSWGYGIQSDGYKGNAYEIKLHGNPWTGYGDESVQARQVLLRIINDLYNCHFIIYTSSNLKSTADSMFFRYDETNVPSPTPNHFAISLNRTDRLRLINSSEQIVAVVRQAILGLSSGAIQKEKIYAGAYEFKLLGNPWWSEGQEAVYARLLILKVLEALRAHGWLVCDSIDISRRMNDKSVLVFRQCQPESRPFLCVAMSDVDKLRLINAPPGIVGLVRSCCGSQWNFGMHSEKDYYYGSYQLRLGGVSPWADWRTSGHNGLHGRSLLLFILDAMQQQQWRLVVSADVSAKYIHQKNGPDYPIDVDCWYFMHDTTLVPPQPSAPPTFTTNSAAGGFTSGLPSYDQVVDIEKH